MIIRGDSIAECWIKSLIVMVGEKCTEISPFVANISTNQLCPDYTDELEHDLNTYLLNEGQNPIETTASTIFPHSLASGQGLVFDRFEKIWKHVKRDSQNYKGHYFRRLVAFNEKSGKPINQLAHIIDTYNGIEGLRKPVHRRSALIALTFDPTLDHTAQIMRGFPCLQQVCFVPNRKTGKLTLNAIYAMQYLASRGYGNYVGLKNLGNFMAGEMGLELGGINCIASVLELKMNKSKAKVFADKYGKYVHAS